MKNKNHVITRNDIEQKCQKSTQSDVVIPNKLSNGKTCQGLLRRFVHKNANSNEISPHNDMDNKILNQVQDDSVVVVQNDATTCAPLVGGPKSLISRRGKNAFDCNQESSPEFVSSPQLTNKFYPLTKREGKKESVKNLFPYFPISLSLKKKAAFTLAETLITLGIIGIVAAMTIPTLISNYQKKQTVTKLQKAISVFNQAYKMSFDEVGNPSPKEAFDMGATKYIDTYWAPYLKINNICKTYSDCGYDSLAPLTFANGQHSTSYVILDKSRIGVQTMDGVTYVIIVSYYNNADHDMTAISNDVRVDLNGGEKPNKYGKDVFQLVRVENKGVFPACYDATSEYVNANCSKSGQGNCCAEKIRRAGWEIDKSYPW